MTAERRNTRRLSIQLPVVLTPEGGEPMACRTLDVSLTGALVDTAAPLALGDWVELRLSGGTFGQPVVVYAQVRRRVGRTGLGMKFDSNSWDAASRQVFAQGIRSLMSQRVASPDPAAAGLFLHATCGACGWEGSASRYARKCPRCNAGLVSAAA